MSISSSIRKLTLFFVAMFIAFSAGLVYWQVVVAQQVTTNPHNGRGCLTDNAAVRGRIFDRNGVLLAESTPSKTCGYIRHYTDPSLAGLIGYYAGPNFPATGLEKQYNDYLSGQIGPTMLDNTMNKILHRPPVGDDLYLTIDDRIQKIVDKHFDDPVPIDNSATFATNRGAVVVTDPHTGEILAMVSRPSYDPNKLVTSLQENGDLTYFNQLVKDPDQPLLMRPLQARYVPGSTFKTVTLLAGLDSGKTTLDQQFDRKQALGPVVVGQHQVGPTGNNLEPYTIRFPVDTEYGYTHSDNVIFAQVGAETGVDTWQDYVKRFYLTQSIPQTNAFKVPVTVGSVTQGDTPLDVNLLADDAFGQGADFVTPMAMSLVDNVAANDGQLMQPMLVSKIVDSNKNPVETNSPTPLGSRQVSSQAATGVRQAMYGVTHCGSGLVAGVDLSGSPWDIISKTGTAELGNNVPAHSWLITSAPYSVSNPTQLPDLTIVAMKEHGGEGGNAVGPMVTNMYNDIFTNVMKIQQPPAVPTNYCNTTQLLQQ
jgi:cell division protein FtsI/penicillin-binding protein 2